MVKIVVKFKICPEMKKACLREIKPCILAARLEPGCLKCMAAGYCKGPVI